MSLTPKQERFVEEYLIDLNATRAYVDAGYAARGNSAEAAASRMLRNDKVAVAIQKAKDERSERTKISADRVLLEYARVAFSNMREFAEWGPDGVTWKESTELPEDAAACVAEVSETVSEGGRTRRFKLHSKTNALKDVATHLGLFPKSGEGVQVTVNNAPSFSHLSLEEKKQLAILHRKALEERDARVALPSRN